MRRVLQGCLAAAGLLAARAVIAPPTHLDGSVIVPVLVITTVALAALRRLEAEEADR